MTDLKQRLTIAQLTNEVASLRRQVNDLKANPGTGGIDTQAVQALIDASPKGDLVVGGVYVKKYLDTTDPAQPYYFAELDPASINTLIDSRLASQYTTPAAPTNLVVDDSNDTATFTPSAGLAATEHEYTTNYTAGSPTWTPATTNVITIGNVAVASGAIAVRVKKAFGRNASSALVSGAPFTVSSGINVGEDLVFTNNSGTNPITLVAGPPRYYLGTAGTDWNSGGNSGVATKKAAAGSNTFASMLYIDAQNELAIIGFNTAGGTNQPLSSYKAGLCFNNGKLVRFENGVNTDMNTVTIPVNARVGVRRAANGTCTIEQTTNGTSFTVLHTFTSFTSTADLFIGIAILDARRVVAPQATNVVTY